ncbi:MAG: hypothetical protein GXY70_06180 [Euryarchaeota archaeon]|nr:hypothetical protein [Euryarchaeota archaeon]
MMELFLSKFWAFLVSLALVAVLVQGVQMDARSDRAQALDDLAEDLERLFHEIASAGEGFERTLHLGSVLPASTLLTLFQGHAMLEHDGMEARFLIPMFKMMMEGSPQEVDRLVLGPNDSLLMLGGPGGNALVALNP